MLINQQPEHNLNYFLEAIHTKTKGRQGNIFDYGAVRQLSMANAGQTYGDAMELCANLINEELSELETAIHAGEPAENVLKEALDLEYVLHYFLATFFDSASISIARARIHENNLAKVKNGTIREDGKLVKPADHPKVNLSDLVKKP
jgi:hypothetical protein